MSGNPKQTAAGGQQIRYSTTYQPIQQLPPRDNYLQNQNYVQQPPNQASTQGVGIRGIAQTGPPNQAPTPPNQDLNKVQAVPQQQPMNIYQQQNTVRPSQFFAARPTPPNQNARMPNNPQRIYQNSPHQYMPVPQMASNVYVPLSYYNAQQRQNFVQPQVILQNNMYQPYQTFTQPQLAHSPQNVSYQYFQIPRPGPPPQPATTPSNPNQAPIASTIPIPQPVIPPQAMSRQPNQRRPNAIPIIDPKTGNDRLNEIYEQDSSHPPSGESSARQTPQPVPHNQSKEVQAPFVKHTGYIYQEGEMIELEFELPPQQSRVTEASEDFHDSQSPIPISQPPLSSRNNVKFDNIAQTSTLKAHAKEFILPSAKEPPVVSANCDSVEVTLKNLQKGRESPIKGRKVKDHHKEPVKHTESIKEVHQVEKQPAPVVKEEPEVPAAKPKETTYANNINQHASKVTEKENDKRKKDNKSDSKQTTETSANDNNKQANQEHEVAAPASKSKQNHKKDNHKSNNQRPNPPNVPPPQPAKSNSKTTKKNELNSKGASKEGNDMDVFQITDTINANIPSPTPVTTTPAINNNDVLNANEIVVPNNIVPTVVAAADETSPADDVAAKAESSINAVPAKPTAEVKQKKWDVTNVFTGGRLPGPSPYVPVLTENNNHDETDRAVTNDRTNVTVTENASQAPAKAADKKPDLPYKEGQWAPHNQSGEMTYERDFLMAIKDLPSARVKPTNLPETLEYSDVARQRALDNRDSRGSNMMGKDFASASAFMPFSGGKNSSMKGSLTKHPSLSGKMGNKGGKPVNGGNKISISLREDIKLHETENAWKPGRLAKTVDKTEDERKTEELYKKVRGVLNKLTPQKFDTLLSQIKALNIDTFERLQGVINLVFEKAIDEPNFAVAYAKMCMEVAMMQVIRKTEDGKEEPVNFRKLLITRCQEEFEKQSRDESKTEEKNKEIQECKDPEKKKELEEELEEVKRRIRMRSVGNVRFIGELFKSNMLTANIMTVCMHVLLQHKDEESLECLCRLLTTIGKKLEEQKDISNFTDIMQKIVDGKEVSSRIRFMLQDVLDLRRNKWVPRRQDAGPKTIDQIARDVATEQLNSQINLNSVPNTPRRDDRDMGRGKMRNQDEWNSHQKPAFLNVNKDKLKHAALTEHETLGQSAMFQKWNKGSTFKPAQIQSQSVTNTSNRFSCLENTNLMENDKKSGGNNGSRYKDSAYSSKGSSLERNNYVRHYDSRGGSRSGSQHRNNDGPGSSGMNAGSNITMSRSIPPQPTAKAPTPPPTAAVPKMTEDQLERYCKNCCDEYINDNCTFEECNTDIRTNVPQTYMSTMVSDMIMVVLEKSKLPRMKLGLLLGKLLASGTVPLAEACKALEDTFDQVPDLIIDIPTIYACLAEILVPIIFEGGLPLSSLQKCFKPLIANEMGDKMLLAIFKLIVCEKGPNYLKELWQSSNSKLVDFMSEKAAETFIQNNQLEFLIGGTPAQGNSELNYEQIEKKLLEFFDSNTPFDDICSWITANVGKRVEENMFIRTLATAIYKYSIVRTKLNTEHLTRHSKLFSKYVDNNPTYELQCLYALQSLVNYLEHPQGLLLSILNKLSEDSIFAQESFLSWENSKDPAEQEGKGVALNQLRAFFTQLKENDDDEEDYVSTGSDEA